MLAKSKLIMDLRGVPMSGCSSCSLDDYETALAQFQSYRGDPTETLAVALENDPEFVMGHIFSANAMLMMTERQYLPAVFAAIESAEALDGKSNNREKMLVNAARHWAEGRWDVAAKVWDKVLAQYPCDAMTLQCAHLTDFFIGDAINLRDRVVRVLGHWHESMPGYSYALGLQAFGLEECNEYARAEETARRALAINAKDGWSVHAVVHVMEMQNRYTEGVEFLNERRDDWAPDNGFAFHNWWHLALFHLEQTEFAQALALYDDHVFAPETEITMEMIDASALLWRLHLYGVDVGNRWNELLALWSPKMNDEPGYYAFNDLHLVAAAVGAGDLNAANAVVAKMRAAIDGSEKFASMALENVGIPACVAMIDFAQQRYDAVIEQLYPMRSRSNMMGGSHAQRDILTQTLLESAIRGGHYGLASNLVNERMQYKADSPLTAFYREKLSRKAAFN